MNYVKPGNRVLEVGTGDVAILSIYLALNRKGCEYTAADIDSKFVENSNINIKKVGVKVNVIQSDGFSNIKEKFDIIFCNPPYNPTSGIDFEYARQYHGFESTALVAQTSDGGMDGLSVVRRYLKEGKNYLTPNGLLILAINYTYVSEQLLKSIIDENGYKIYEEIKYPNTGHAVLVMQPTYD